MKRIISGLLVVLILISNFPLIPVKAEEDKVLKLINGMTLEQKVGQMLQPDTRSITPDEVKKYHIGSILSGGGASPSSGNTARDWANRLNEYQSAAIEGSGIPLLYGVDAVHGHNNVLNATIFPHNIGLGQADDVDLIKRIAEITAKEVRATGANWTFTPTLGLPKNERWGRTYECYGENAELSAKLGAAYIEGSQLDLNNTGVMATAKHFIGEGIATDGINQGDIPYDYNGLEFQDILKGELIIPYKAAIEAGAKSVMISYNSIGGVKCHGNKELITNLLKGELGFSGIVITDYNGVDQIEGKNTYQEKVVTAVNAGIDMLMVDGYEGNDKKWLAAINAIISGVKNGQIAEDRISDAVYRILKVKDDLGLLDNEKLAYADEELLKEFGGAEHREVAREAVRKSLTLLKNSYTNNETSTLMKDLKDMDKLVVAGSSANDIGMQSGGWTITWQGSAGNITEGTTIYEGLKEVADDSKTIDYKANGYFSEDSYDAAIVAIGEEPYAEYAGDRTESQLKLRDADINVINNIKKYHPDLPIIAVLTTGRPITIVEQLEDFDAVIMAGFPGTEGAGIADVLLGDYDFTGHLTFTWPWYANDITLKLKDETKVLFEYGRGLTKDQVTPIRTDKPVDGKVIDLEKTGGVVQAEAYYSKHNDINLENNGTSIGHFWQGRDLIYKVNIPESAKYRFVLNTATANQLVNVAMDVYVDGKKFYSSSKELSNTGGWNSWKEIEMDDSINLPIGEHTIKIVSQSKDFNVDYFKYIKTDGEYEEPKDDSNNVGNGTLIEKNAVSVTMSSSENSQSMNWYKGEQPIENTNSKKDYLDITNADSSDLTTISIDDDKVYQDVLGIGISIEESTVNNIMKMSEEERKSFIRRLVSPEDGMGNTLFRVTIGTSDFTGREFYTYYDGTGKELDGQPDWYNETGNGFTIQKDKDYNIIKVVKEILEVAEEEGVKDDIKFFASSWSPPGWMKKSTSASNSYPNNDKLLKGGALRDEHIEDLAKYYVRFIEEYQKEGIPIYAMTLQNEPLLEINYPSCYITGKQEAKLAKAIKEELNKSTILNEEEKNVKVWAFDHNFSEANSFVNDLFATEDGRENVDGIAFHPYGGVPETMGALYEKYKDKYTMNLTERSVWGTNGANDIITWFRNGSESYNSWVTMLDSNISPHQWVGTPDPTLFVKDAESKDGYWATPEVYIMGQFTKYIRPGFARIDSTNGSSSTVTNVAFKDPKTGEIVMVVANRSGKDQTFKVVMDGTQFNATLPAGNVATYSWTPIEESEYKDITNDLTLDDVKLIGNGTIENNIISGVDSTTKLDYLVNVKQAGTYKVTFDIAAGGEWDKDYNVLVSQSDNVLGKASIRRYVSAENEKYNTYSQIQTFVTFEGAGLQKVTLSFPEGGLNFKDVHFSKMNSVITVPGKVDTSNSFFTHGLVKGETENFAFSDIDDYVDYKVDVQKAGTYDLILDVATTEIDSGFGIYSFMPDKYDYDNSTEGTYLGDAEIIKTGDDMSIYQKQTVEVTFKEAGEQFLRFKFNKGNTNLKSIIIGNAINISNVELIEGSLDGKAFNVELESGKFNDSLDKKNWNLDLPEGVEFSITRIDYNNVSIILSGEAERDFDVDKDIKITVNASEYGGTNDTFVEGIFKIIAVNDLESLEMDKEISFGQEEVNIKLIGGTFADDLSNKIELTGTASKYVTIEEVNKIDKNTVKLVLKWNLIYGSAVNGTITLKQDAYDDGSIPLSVESRFNPTNEEPKAIEVNNVDSVSLTEDKSYRSEGSISSNAIKGNYVDFYLDIEEEGNYVISYKVKNNNAISNGLKISGGLGYATDNKASISFTKFWGATLGYKNTLNFEKGKQTLRFEINGSSDGFEIKDITIKKLNEPVDIKATTTITADQTIGGSTDLGWAIETKNGQNSIGNQVVGSYQDYYVNVEQAGIYEFKIKSGRNTVNNATAILQKVNGTEITELGSVEAAKTGSWDTFKDSEIIEVELRSGNQILRIYDDIDGFNYSSFTLSLKEASYPPVINASNAEIELGDSLNSINLSELFKVKVENAEIDDVKYDISKVDTNKIGEYDVVITVEANGTSVNKTVKLQVKDTKAPIIKAEDAIVELGCKDALKDIIGLVVKDADNAVYEIETNYDPNVVGEYEVKIIATDNSGNKSSKVVKVSVINNVVVTIDAENAEVELNTDLNSINLDELFKVKVENAEIDNVKYDISKVDTNKIGKYDIVISVEANGTSVNKTVKLQVKDTKAPIIKAEDAVVELGCKDALKDIIGLIVEDADNAVYKIETSYNPNVVGEYEVKIIATDNSGNESRKVVKVSVVNKTVVTINAENAEVELNTDLSSINLIELFKVKVDNASLDDIKFDLNSVNINKIGRYSIVISLEYNGEKISKVVELTVKDSKANDSTNSDSEVNGGIVNTGDENYSVIYISLAILSAFMILLLSKKKKNET